MVSVTRTEWKSGAKPSVGGTRAPNGWQSQLESELLCYLLIGIAGQH